MRSHVPHTDEAHEEGEGPGELVDHEGIFGGELVLGGADVRGEADLDVADLVLDLILSLSVVLIQVWLLGGPFVMMAMIE